MAVWTDDMHCALQVLKRNDDQERTHVPRCWSLRRFNQLATIVWTSTTTPKKIIIRRQESVVAHRPRPFSTPKTTFCQKHLQIPRFWRDSLSPSPVFRNTPSTRENPSPSLISLRLLSPSRLGVANPSPLRDANCQ